MSIPEKPQLSARAKFDGDTGVWDAHLLAALDASTGGEPVPVEAKIDADGNRDLYTLRTFRARVGPESLTAHGQYDLQHPNGLNVDAALDASEGLEPQTGPVQGHVRGSFHVSGAMYEDLTRKKFHPQLGISGDLRGFNIVLANRPVGNLELRLNGTVDNRTADLRTTELELFEGRWHLAAHYPGPGAGRNMRLTVDVTNLPVPELASFADVKDIDGVLTAGHWDFDYGFGGLSSLSMKSHYSLRDLTAGAALVVDKVEADAAFADNTFTLAPVVATHTEAGLTGTAEITAETDLTELPPKFVHTTFKATNWPKANGPDRGDGVGGRADRRRPP